MTRPYSNRALLGGGGMERAESGAKVGQRKPDIQVGQLGRHNEEGKTKPGTGQLFSEYQGARLALPLPFDGGISLDHPPLTTRSLHSLVTGPRVTDWPRDFQMRRLP